MKPDGPASPGRRSPLEHRSAGQSGRIVSPRSGGSIADRASSAVLADTNGTLPSASARWMPAGLMLCDFRQWMLFAPQVAGGR